MRKTAIPGAKPAAFLLAIVLLSSSFAFIGGAEQEAPLPTEQTTTLEGVTAVSDAFAASSDDLPQPVFVNAEGKFSPSPLDPGDAKILLLDRTAKRLPSAVAGLLPGDVTLAGTHALHSHSTTTEIRFLDLRRRLSKNKTI